MPSATEKKIMCNVVGEASCTSANRGTISFLHCFVLEVHIMAFLYLYVNRKTQSLYIFKVTLRRS